ncbi:hypothetical protein RND81_06G197500 [Saponaria officinalis]|uniref:Uncharacterized protein n=1 Tax=Saponaria officinalis TaxID=3572 RepID=A0AAW1KCY5_SAPOF
MANTFDPKMSKPQKCESECKAIHESSGGLTAAVRALSTRATAVQRREIKDSYKAIYGEELISHLHKLKLKFSNNNNKNNNEGVKYMVKTCEGLILWMEESWERDAWFAKEAIEKNDEANYMVLVEMFVGRKSSHVIMIKQAYQSRFLRLLDQDIVHLEPPHPYQRILVALSTSHKAHHEDVSQDIAKCDAMRLYQTGEGTSSSINEAVVLELLCKRSIPQLKLTFSSYNHIYGHSYTKQLKKIHSTQFEDAFRNVVECIQDPPKYYAKMLQKSMKGGETSRGSLTRLMVSRAEVDMGDIQKAYKKKYGVELKDTITQVIPSGVYRDFLLTLANNA